MGSVARKTLTFKSASILFVLVEVMNGSKSLSVSRAPRGLSGVPSGQRVHAVVEGGAGTDHRIRVANHHVLDTLLGLRLFRGGPFNNRHPNGSSRGG